MRGRSKFPNKFFWLAYSILFSFMFFKSILIPTIIIIALVLVVYGLYRHEKISHARFKELIEREGKRRKKTTVRDKANRRTVRAGKKTVGAENEEVQ